MHSNFVANNYETYDLILDEIVSWVSGFGIRVNPTRIGSYRSSFSELLHISRTKDFTNAEERINEFLNTLYEFHELQEIYKGLREERYSEYVRPRIEKLVSGPTSYLNETTEKGDARNYGLELLLASKLSQGGIFVPPANAADASCRIDGKATYFECKRPQSVDTIEKNIKRACKQLKNRYSRSLSSLSRGIVCIDITKAFNPKFGKLKYSTEADLKLAMENAISSFEEHYLKTLHSITEKRTIAVLVRISVLAEPIDVNARIAYCQQYGLLVLPDASEVDSELAKSIGFSFQK